MHISMKNTYQSVVLAFLLAMLSACSSAPDIHEGDISTGETRPEPIWITDGCQAFWPEPDKHRHCFVAVTGGSNSIESLRKRAVKKARAKMSADMLPEIKKIVEKHAKSRHGHAFFGKPADANKIHNVSLQVTHHILDNVEVNSIWVPSKNNIYALVSYTDNHVQDALINLNQNMVSDELKKELVAHAKSFLHEIAQKEKVRLEARLKAEEEKIKEHLKKTS